ARRGLSSDDRRSRRHRTPGHRPDEPRRARRPRRDRRGAANHIARAQGSPLGGRLRANYYERRPIKPVSGGPMSAEPQTERAALDVRGRILRSDDEDYAAARHIWNGMIDRRPGLIVQAAGAADVVATI